MVVVTLVQDSEVVVKDRLREVRKVVDALGVMSPKVPQPRPGSDLQESGERVLARAQWPVRSAPVLICSSASVQPKNWKAAGKRDAQRGLPESSTHGEGPRSEGRTVGAAWPGRRWPRRGRCRGCKGDGAPTGPTRCDQPKSFVPVPVPRTGPAEERDDQRQRACLMRRLRVSLGNLEAALLDLEGKILVRRALDVAAEPAGESREPHRPAEP